MLEITVINCDDLEVHYEWNSKREFIVDINSDNFDIPMLDDILKAVDTDDNELSTWWRNSNETIVNDLYKECMRELAIDEYNAIEILEKYIDHIEDFDGEQARKDIKAFRLATKAIEYRVKQLMLTSGKSTTSYDNKEEDAEIDI